MFILGLTSLLEHSVHAAAAATATASAMTTAAPAIWHVCLSAWLAGCLSVRAPELVSFLLVVLLDLPVGRRQSMLGTPIRIRLDFQAAQQHITVMQRSGLGFVSGGDQN